MYNLVGRDYYNWVLSHLKEHLQCMMKYVIEEAERWGLEPKPATDSAISN